jgi:hypothetical protein
LTTSAHQPADVRINRLNALFAAVVVACLAGAVYVGAIYAGVYNLRAASDQKDYHLLVIEQFSHQAPYPDFSSYRSATGPGYHVVLAAVHRLVTTDLRGLRVVGSLFAVALLAVLAWAAGRRVHWVAAMVLCLPMLASLYVFGSAVWLLPDDAAWLTVLVAILVAFHGMSRSAVEAWYANIAVLLAAAVFVRQINLWPLGAIVVGMMLAKADDHSDDPNDLAPPLRHRAWTIGALTTLVGIPAVVVLAYFHHLWHGLTPPPFQHVNGPLPRGHSGWQHEGPNLAVPTMVLSVLGVAGAFFVGFLWPVRRMLVRHGQLIACGAVLGLIAAMAVRTNWNEAEGRYSGLWNVSKRFPVFAERSTLMIALAALGGGMLAAWFVALNRRDRWIWLAAWACFIAAQTANAMAWHKYYEPFCLMMFAIAASRLTAARESRASRVPRWAYAGPVALAALLAGVTLSNLTKGG